MDDDRKEQKKYHHVFADSRLLTDCVYCGNPVEDRDHIPAKVFLNEPYPENLDVLQSCRNCNGTASKDEEYVACTIEVIKQGTLDLLCLRPKISETLKYQKKLYERLKSDVVATEQFELKVDLDRFNNVFLKLAKGHAAHELSHFDFQDNCKISWAPLNRLNQDQVELFMKPPLLELFPEIGSRGMQRAFEHGQYVWIEVQKEQYYYMAYESHEGIFVRIFLSNFLIVEAFFPHE